VARRQVFDPPAWSVVAITALCGERGDPFFMEKLLSGDGIDVTGDLARALVASQEESRKRLGDREAILLVSFNNVD
jgi:hypothetical protein